MHNPNKVWNLRCLSGGFGYPLKELSVKKNKSGNWQLLYTRKLSISAFIFNEATSKWVNLGYASENSTPYRKQSTQFANRQLNWQFDYFENDFDIQFGITSKPSKRYK